MCHPVVIIPRPFEQILFKCIKYDHMLIFVDRMQFVGKQNEVLLSEYVDTTTDSYFTHLLNDNR